MGELERLRLSMRTKAYEMAEKLAVRGAVVASNGFRTAIYNGKNDVEVNVVKRFNTYRIVAEGQSALFIEFGAGAAYGYGHPQANEFGYGPGTWDKDIIFHSVFPPENGPWYTVLHGKGHWDDPNGWYFTNEFGDSEHTFGNPPAMAMYRAAKEIRQNLPIVAKEVFKS